MEMEDKQSTESGSLEADSSSGNEPTNKEVIASPPVTVNGGVPVTGDGELKKKRGRPRKYDADGNLNPSYLKTTPFKEVQQPGFTLSGGPSYEHSSGSKRGRGKHSGSGSGNSWQVLGSLGELFTSTAGGDFTPHVVTVNAGEDVAGKILTFAHKGARGICVLSANGAVSNVTIRQPGSSGGLLSYEGRFEILTLTGSFTISDNDGMKSRTGGLSVSLASTDGRVIGGSVSGLLMAAAPIQCDASFPLNYNSILLHQIVVGTFVPNGFQTQKKRPHVESRMSPPVQYAPATVTAAVPISQAPPQSQNYSIPMPHVPVQSQGGVNNIVSNQDRPNSAFTETADWNISGPSSVSRPSPDINISIPVEDH